MKPDNIRLSTLEQCLQMLFNDNIKVSYRARYIAIQLLYHWGIGANIDLSQEDICRTIGVNKVRVNEAFQELLEKKVLNARRDFNRSQGGGYIYSLPESLPTFLPDYWLLPDKLCQNLSAMCLGLEICTHAGVSEWMGDWRSYRRRMLLAGLLLMIKPPYLIKMRRFHAYAQLNGIKEVDANHFIREMEHVGFLVSLERLSIDPDFTVKIKASGFYNEKYRIDHGALGYLEERVAQYLIDAHSYLDVQFGNRAIRVNYRQLDGQFRNSPTLTLDRFGYLIEAIAGEGLTPREKVAELFSGAVGFTSTARKVGEHFAFYREGRSRLELEIRFTATMILNEFGILDSTSFMHRGDDIEKLCTSMMRSFTADVMELDGDLVAPQDFGNLYVQMVSVFALVFVHDVLQGLSTLDSREQFRTPLQIDLFEKGAAFTLIARLPEWIV